MINRRRKRDERGFTLLEVVVSILIIVIAMGATASYQLMTNHTMQVGKDRVFGTQKAMQIMEELRAYTESGGERGMRVLDTFDDSTSYPHVLTVDTVVTSPSDPLSGNKRMNNRWVFCRQVKVTTIPAEPKARRVTVKVFYTDKENQNLPGRTLGEVSTVLSSVAETYPSSQVYDVYVIALESVPTMWTDMASTWGRIQSAISRIQTRNAGLEFRTHWIRRMSYGRDPYYTAHTNYALSPTSTINWVYYYPGTMDPNRNLQYYLPLSFRSRIHVDDTLLLNPTSYALADQFNHAMRYPDEIATYNWYLASNPDHEISYRMFLEDMISYPERYENSIIINAHGQMLPLPPIRNFSDPAKDPVDHPGARVVVHPENLQYSTVGSFALRVYPYTMFPDTGSLEKLDTVCVKVIGAAALSNVEIIVGNDTTTYARRSAVLGDEYQVTSWGDSVKILLLGSNLRHSYNATTGQGLHTSERLYDLEYIPCPAESACDFSQDLTSAGSAIAKNTARWVIHLNATKAQIVTIETSIGDKIDYSPNLSSAFTWIGLIPPVTEQFQMIGDPRHVPYADVKIAGNYNRYFVSVPTSYGGFSDTRSGWETYVGNTVPDNDPDCDVWRLTELVRTALLRSHSIYIPMSGFTSRYIGFGGEFGGDLGLIGTQMLDGTPWKSGSAVLVDEMVDVGADKVKPRIVASIDHSWCSIPWLGELYPDNEFAANWSPNGNLPTSNYYRAEYEDVGLPYYRSKSLGERGCATFANATKKNGNFYFMHDHANSNEATATAAGEKLQVEYNIDLPKTFPCPAPFVEDYGSWTRKPVDWEDYAAERCTSELFTEYYSSSYGSYRGSATLFLEESGDYSYFLLSGGSHTDAEGARMLARMMLIEAVDCFLRAGNPIHVQDYRRIRQIPRAAVTNPTASEEYENPSNIHVEWKLSWRRWDGEKYRAEYTESFEETTDVVVCLKYSDDAGKTWAYLDDVPADVGVRPDASHEIKHQESCNWDVSSLPSGEYLLRLEAYRANIEPHYSYHQVLVIIERLAT